MQITLLSGLDISFRLLAVGQLLLVCVLLARKTFSGQTLSLLSVAVCMAAYLLLTAPIPDAHYGVARNLLLTLTDAFGYSIWFAALYTFEEDFRPSRWPWWVKVGLGLFAVWYLYFFGVRQGRGLFHDVNHLINILLLGHVIVVALRGWNDDLLGGRRRARVVVALLASGYGITLATLELLGPVIYQGPLVGLINSGALLLAIPLLVWFLSQNGGRAVPNRSRPAEAFVPVRLRGEDRILAEKLDDFVHRGGYLEPNLTIKRLAERLACPEYRLRRLINSALGFNNFSRFLNHYRLLEACQRLQDEPSTPILNLALELGYGSIGPFNRAFKASYGCTPTEYRRDCHNQPPSF